MKPLCRREFLHCSALASAACLMAACKFPISAVPHAQPGETRAPTPLPTGTLNTDTTAIIDKVVSYAMESNKVPGMAVGIVKDGKLVFAKGYGVAKQGEDRPVTPQTLFRIMNLTDLFTAAAGVQLAEQGKLDLDAPIVEVLPYFKLQDERYQQITTRHLLSESAGLPSTPWINPSKDWAGKTPQRDADALERYVRSLGDVKLERDPGSLRAFSNMSYDIAGDVIAKASGQGFEDYMANHVLTPLGMTQSTLFPETAEPSSQAAPHVVEWPDPVASDLVTYSRERAPSVGLLSNVDELTRWVAADLNRGTLAEERFLPASAYDQLWKSTAMLDDYFYEKGTDMVDGGLGWLLGTAKGHPVCHFWGLDVGFHAEVYLAPENNTGIVVLGNQFSGVGATDFYAYTVASTLLPLIAFG